MGEIQKELVKKFRESQEKFVYYIIALSVSAIGFAIYRTVDKELNLTQIPLGLSVLSWGISIYCGLNFLKFYISQLFDNAIYLEFKSDNTINESKKATDLKKMKIDIINNSEIGLVFFNWQNKLFYTGIVLFIIWHIIEMYFNNCCNM
jgi:hypothetical protein